MKIVYSPEPKGPTLISSKSDSSIEVIPFTLGPVQSNGYLIGDSTSGTAVVIDPGWDGDLIFREAESRNWRIAYIWLTHAHFDHFGGAAQIADSSPTPVEVALHPEDQSLWRAMGGASAFGFSKFDPGPEPTIPLADGMLLHLGEYSFEVHHTPGHSRGHVIFVSQQEKLVFCGDLIFMQGVGRTDLPGGDWSTLIKSIKDRVLTLPDDFRLLSGHGPETTVGQERGSNPFLV
jgi:glyoxylase-like metal-dependent hydrolase (beta-lactamase superfamily II)